MQPYVIAKNAASLFLYRMLNTMSTIYQDDQQTINRKPLIPYRLLCITIRLSPGVPFLRNSIIKKLK